MKKNPGDVISLNVYQKLSLDDAQFLRYSLQQMNRQTDRRTDEKSDI